MAMLWLKGAVPPIPKLLIPSLNTVKLLRRPEAKIRHRTFILPVSPIHLLVPKKTGPKVDVSPLHLVPGTVK